MGARIADHSYQLLCLGNLIQPNKQFLLKTCVNQNIFTIVFIVHVKYNK